MAIVTGRRAELKAAASPGAAVDTRSDARSGAESAPAQTGLPHITRFDRLELKFLLGAAQRDFLVAAVAERMERDAYAQADGRYLIASVYYDNADRDVYFDRARGLWPRHKLRVRVYGLDTAGPTVAFVEIKTKLRRRVVKRRVWLPAALALELAAGTRPDVAVPPRDQPVVEDTLRMVRIRHLSAACLIHYRRRAFSGGQADPGLRVTFDDDLVARFDDPTNFGSLAGGFDVAPEGYTVLEVKADDAVPQWLTRVLGQAGATVRSYSKYCRAVELGGFVGPAPAIQLAKLGAVRAADLDDA